MPTHRRFLIVQIDGLSRVVLEQGLASGRMPFVKRMLEGDGYRMEPMSVSLPTSTPAFQMATFYGLRPDIPGFHYYSRERQTDIHFPRSGHAAWVEARHAGGGRGILRGGSAYGCCFTGGADNKIDGWQTGQTTSVRLDAHALDRGYGSRAGTAIAITSVGHPGVWYLESTNVALSRTKPHMVRLRSRGTQAAMNIQFALPPAPRPLRKVLHFTLPRCRK